MNSEENQSEQTLKGGRGECGYCGEWHNNVSYHEQHECDKRPCWDCNKPQDECECGTEDCPECGEEIGGMCVCNIPSENFAERIGKSYPPMEEVIQQMKAGPHREHILNMLKDIVKEVDYDIYNGLFVNPEESECAEEKIEELIRIVQSHLR